MEIAIMVIMKKIFKLNGRAKIFKLVANALLLNKNFCFLIKVINSISDLK